MLVGREPELQQLEALLDEARRGRSGTVAIVGEAGTGKTALLEHMREQAADLRCLLATGVESESELPFASLHELLGPLLELLPRIPEAQAHALSAGLALADGETAMLAVGAGTFSLLVEAADRVPLLVLLDDTQWFDSASAQAISFAVRRLKAEQIAVVAASRPNPGSAFEAFPTLDLQPLPPPAARSLLRTRPAAVSPADEGRVLDAAAGNPLALLELPVELADELPRSATGHRRLERAFAPRLDRLPEQTRLALLLVAAEPDALTVRRVLETQGARDPIALAETAGLVRLRDGTAVFRHPVVRSLVYSTATTAERSEAHRALAAVLDSEPDRDRRAWHLGAAADSADESVAALLEETADRAMARGGHAAAARALELAARLSPAKADRARRLYAASRSEGRGGDMRKARALIEEALPLADDPVLHFDLSHELRAISDWSEMRASESTLLGELEATAGLDGERRAKLLIFVVMQRLNRFDAAGAVALVPLLERYASAAGADWKARGFGTGASAHLLAGEREEAIRSFRAAVSPALATMVAFDYMSLEWYDELRDSLSDTLRQARGDRNLHRIIWNRSCAAHLELRHGRLGAAEAAAAEAIELGALLNDPKGPVACAALAGVHAWRGNSDSCTANARQASHAARAAGDLFPDGLAHGALALLALGTGRPADAITELEPLAQRWRESTVRDPAATPYIPDLVEAYLLVGDTAKAHELLDRFTPLAEAAENIWMLAACARCEGLLATSDEFEHRFIDALRLLEPTSYTLDLARTRLAFGSRLRRTGRRSQAKSHLQAAHDMFAAAGAQPWQQRAAAELRAAGVQVTDSTAPAIDLSPQELAIATLVAQGKSNPEIAAAVYLSRKTIEYHLSGVFRKLNIHSRVELARLMASLPE